MLLYSPVCNEVLLTGELVVVWVRFRRHDLASKLKKYLRNTPIKLIAVILFAIFVPSVLVTALGLVAVFQAQGFVRDRFTQPVRERVDQLYTALQSEWSRRLEHYNQHFRDSVQRRDFLGDIRGRDPYMVDLLFAGPAGPSLVPDPPPLRLWSLDPEARLKELHRLELLSKDYPSALRECLRLLESGEDDAVLVEARIGAARVSHKLGDREQSLSHLRAALAKYGYTMDVTGIVRGLPILLRIAELERESGRETRRREALRELRRWIERVGNRMDPELLSFFRERATSIPEGDVTQSEGPTVGRLGSQHLSPLSTVLPGLPKVLASALRIETHVQLGELGEWDFVSFPSSDGAGVVHLALSRAQVLREGTRLCGELGLPVGGLSICAVGEGRGSANEIRSTRLPPPFTNLEMRYVSVAGLLPEGFRAFGVLTLATFTWAVIVLVLSIVIGVLFTVRSVSRELKTARLKSDFVSFITHELKTPLTAISTLTETMLAGRISSPEESQLCIQMISTESERLSKLVAQVLEYSKIERQEKQFRFVSCDMENVVREAARLFAEHNRTSPREIEINSAQHISRIKMDRASMVELVLNLLSNAAKYSPREKKIVVNLRESIDDICVDVVDRGIGIRKRDQKKIFEKFFRADDYLTREIEGTGLGLAFARYIARVHNGDIKVTSQLSTGSTFTLQLRKTHVLAE